MKLYYSDQYEIPLPPGHRFPVRKYRMLREVLQATGLFDFAPAPLADPTTIALIHERTYVQNFLAGSLDSSVIRRIGFPWSQQLVQRTLASVGSTVAASRDALRCGRGGGLAGGTHHAFSDTGSGFCVFNDMAVAIAVLREEGKIRRAAILDLDVHQGDGTAKIFEDDDNVLTISIHGQNNFPFRKQTSSLDVGLPDGAGDDEFLEALTRVLPKAIEFRPDILFFQSGVDGLASDKLGRLQLTCEGLAERDKRVFMACMQAGIPCVVTLGGGYSDPIDFTVHAHATTFRLMAEISRPSDAHVPGRRCCGPMQP
ncbi:MAG TPA: histone deacetylase [Bryobacteraceae bacterium]|nr:histone deacetylase [Bryobacteraceae bacterium]